MAKLGFIERLFYSDKVQCDENIRMACPECKKFTLDVETSDVGRLQFCEKHFYIKPEKAIEVKFKRGKWRWFDFAKGDTENDDAILRSNNITPCSDDFIDYLSHLDDEFV